MWVPFAEVWQWLLQWPGAPEPRFHGPSPWGWKGKTGPLFYPSFISAFLSIPELVTAHHCSGNMPSGGWSLAGGGAPLTSSTESSYS